MRTAAALTLLAVTACGSQVSSSQPLSRTASSGAEPQHASGSQPAAPHSADPYPLIAGKVAIYVRVAQTRLADDGRPFDAELVLINGLGRSFVVPAACNGWLAVGLASSSITSRPLYTLMGCAGLTVPVGLTDIRRTVQTTYSGCTQNRQDKATANAPTCLGNTSNLLPPLPPGAYRLQLDTHAIPNAVVRTPVTITLVKS
jgi:hypothetical protein